MSERYDLIVVGGGLGGSSLAASMAQHGVRVLLLERTLQFHDRVRGECMFPWGVAEAIQPGLFEFFRQQCAHELPWMDFYSGGDLMVHRPVVDTMETGSEACARRYQEACSHDGWDSQNW